MGAEDFAFYLEKRPGSFFFVGVNPSETEPYPPLHNPRFNFSDETLPTSVEAMCRLAVDYLAEGTHRQIVHRTGNYRLCEALRRH